MSVVQPGTVQTTMSSVLGDEETIIIATAALGLEELARTHHALWLFMCNAYPYLEGRRVSA